MAFSKFKKRVIIVVAFLAALLLVICVRYLMPEEHIRLQSPDNRHTLIVYRYQRFFAMPGQGSDAPGFVKLVDKAGRELNRTEIEMVQLAYETEWFKDRVRIRLILDWPR